MESQDQQASLLELTSSYEAHFHLARYARKLGLFLHLGGPEKQYESWLLAASPDDVEKGMMDGSSSSSSSSSSSAALTATNSASDTLVAWERDVEIGV